MLICVKWIRLKKHYMQLIYLAESKVLQYLLRKISSSSHWCFCWVCKGNEPHYEISCTPDTLQVLLVVFGLVSLFNGISTFAGYLMPKLFSKKSSSDTI